MIDEQFSQLQGPVETFWIKLSHVIFIGKEYKSISYEESIRQILLTTGTKHIILDTPENMGKLLRY